MKKATLIAIVVTLSTVMFAGVNVTWGNTYTDDAGTLTSASSFGVWFDVNDATSLGWEGGLKVGFDGPAGMQMRLGMDPDGGGDTSVGVSRAWWTSTGDGWGTNLSTAIDWGMTGANEGDFTLTMNLGFGW